MPYLYGLIIDSISKFDMNKTLVLISINFIISIIHSIFESYEIKKSSCLAVQISNNIKNDIFKNILIMKMSNLDIYTKGELINRIENSSDATVQYFLQIIKNAVVTIINLIFPLIFIFNISGELSLTAMAIMPLMMIITFLFQSKINKLQKENSENSDLYKTHIYHSIDTIENIRAYQIENQVMSVFKNNLLKIFKVFTSQQNVGQGIKVLQDIMISIFNFIVLLIASHRIASGEMQIGSLVSFAMYIGIFFEAVASIMTFSLGYEQNIVNIIRILEIGNADLENNSDSLLSANELCDITEIKIKNLNFAYKGKDLVLNNLSIEIMNAGWYSIIGDNGCGKSTLLKVLEKFYDCEKNTIFINGNDICDIAYNDLRREICYTSKNHYILNATIRDNLKISGNGISDFEIENALKNAGLYDFIMTLSDGLNTLIGDGAMQLSSGQKQKLMLARVMLRKSSVILIDEATSDLDIHSEQEIIKIMKKLSKDKIILSISHRTSFIVQSDKIFCMGKGCFYDSGTHEELLSRSVFYKNIFLALLNDTNY
ncbi:ABC transporter ATP-binding protein/permease [Clostridioides difficile]|nr:ABC transporter ATP-binding protein/permease [Clostridioides difficile]